jgi:hypothetical protein
MFFLVASLVCANIILVPYYFTYQLEYIIINYLIPMLNNIYVNRGIKRYIEVKVFTEKQTEPINMNILHSEELNQINDKKYLSYDEIKFEENGNSTKLSDFGTYFSLPDNNQVTKSNIESNDDTEDENDSSDNDYDKILSKNIVNVFHDSVSSIIADYNNSENEPTSETILVEPVN